MSGPQRTRTPPGHGDDDPVLKNSWFKAARNQFISPTASFHGLIGGAARRQATARFQRRGTCALAFGTLCSFQGAGCAPLEFRPHPDARQQRDESRLSSFPALRVFRPDRRKVFRPLAARTFGPVAVVSKELPRHPGKDAAAAERNSTASTAKVQPRHSDHDIRQVPDPSVY